MPRDTNSDQSPAAIIEIRVERLNQLFSSLDPAPFRERDLDDDAEEYIVGWARELPRTAHLKIRLHLPQGEAEKTDAGALAAAFTNYFAYRAQIHDSDLKENFRNGWRFLLMGTPVLIACLSASQMTSAYLGAGTLAGILEESLIIVGWVANWKPIETFLYDWWPIKRRRDLYRRLQSATIELHARP